MITTSSKPRIEYIDFIKGLAIFLVIWGHSIQNFGLGDESFFENPLHILICSFHMPIFMVVSGFFFYKSLRLNFGQLLTGKLRQLMLPIFSWTIIMNLLAAVQNGMSSLSVKQEIYDICYGTVTNFWFIRSVFICYLLTFLSKRIFSKDYIACIASILFFLALTDNFRLALDKFMFPFFWMGYFMHKYLDILNRYKKTILVTSLIVWIILLCFWDKKYYIYVTGCAFYHIEHFRLVAEDFFPRLQIVAFRYLIGIAGSFAFFFFAQRIYRPFFHFIAAIGQKTLGIYIIHILLMGFIIPYLQWPESNFYLFSLVYTPLTAAGLLSVSLLITWLLEKNKFTNLVFLGGRYNKNKP